MKNIIPNQHSKITEKPIIILLAIALIYIVTRCEAAIQTRSQELISSLLGNYNRHAKPVIEPQTPINVTFVYRLIQLIDVNDRAQLITTKAWIRQAWHNELLTWNVSEWGGIKNVHLDSTLIWSPDVVLYDNADRTFPGGTQKYKTRMNLFSDGNVEWFAPVQFVSTCKIDVTHFPFDRQDCTLKFGSWTGDVNAIDMIAGNEPVLIPSNYVNSTEWDVLEAKQQRNELKYDCCPVSYSDVTVTIKLQRKSLYYMFHAILPCIVLLLLVLASFYLPPESGERISLTITILLAVALFLQLVSTTLPRNSDSVPNLAIYYFIVEVESALSLVTTCFVLRLYNRGNGSSLYRLPLWCRKFFLKHLGYMLRVQGLPSVIDENKIQSEDTKVTATVVGDNNLQEAIALNNYRSCYDYQPNTTGTNGLLNRGPFAKKMSTEFGNNIDISPEEQTVKLLSSIDDSTKIMADNITSDQAKEVILQEWRSLGKVLDKMFFWTFTLVAVLSTIILIVPSALHLGHD